MKRFFVVLLLAFSPSVVIAAEGDYLYVSLSYDFRANKIAILAVEQRVLDPSQVLISEFGDFELLLVESGKDKNKVVSRNTFTMPIDEEIEVLTKGGGRYVKPKSYSTTVALPFNQSLDSRDLNFQVRKDGRIIFKDKFPVDVFTILAVRKNTIKTPIR